MKSLLKGRHTVIVSYDSFCKIAFYNFLNAYFFTFYTYLILDFLVVIMKLSRRTVFGKASFCAGKEESGGEGAEGACLLMPLLPTRVMVRLVPSLYSLTILNWFQLNGGKGQKLTAWFY